LDRLFKPRSIAVVGASPNPRSIGNLLLKRILDYGFQGRVYPVNPKYSSILGLKCYPSVSSIGEHVDLAIVVTPAEVAVKVAEDCAKAGVEYIVVASGGFKEVGARGAELERKLVEAARAGGARVVGPNCMGVYSPRGRVTLFEGFPREPGDVALVSHSGGMAEMIVMMLAERGLGISLLASTGNEADLTLVDFIEYMSRDEDTRVIGGYIEQVKDGRRFLEEARKAAARKPIVLMKVGRGEAGRRAALFHTGALAGMDKVLSAAFKQAGVIRAETLLELVEYCMTFSRLNPTPVRGVGVITGPGGLGVVLVDAVEQAGLKAPEFTEETKLKLREILPPVAGVSNPADLTLAMVRDIDLVRRAALILDKDPKVDVMMVGVAAVLTYSRQIAEEFAKVMSEAGEQCSKPLVAVCPHVGEAETHLRKLVQAGIPVYLTPESAASSLAALSAYHKAKMKLTSPEAAS